ncbi:hypothetical protein LGM43_14740 [Burkholderia seminalis]|uniref:hypothetical protein n=1 Tax=Burkholderia seminalis TaxID=488731 RepID=UPI001CF43545|nr:hypothetical protein [Burkholderia seminalis]MCA7951527.1 hypothetical protein [Burkholderia seminalis]
MAATERITMTMRELDRFKVIQDVADGKLKPWRAAERHRRDRACVEPADRQLACATSSA